MADENPRRSVRATKGQHTKTLDLLDQPTPEPKKKSNKKAKKVEVEEEEAEVIRCVCGALESPDGDEEPWIACDNCNVWQHNVCVGVPTYDEDLPKNYLCEQCGPQSHKDLLGGLKKGIKLWEQRRTTYEKMKADEEKGAKKKGKKKGGNKRISDPEPQATNGKAKSPATPVPEAKKDKKEAATKSSSSKRKARDESQDKELAKEPQSKVRKVSAAHITARQDTPVSGLTARLIDLEHRRQGGGTLVHKGLKFSIPIAIKNSIYTLKQGVTAEEKAESLAIEVEDAVNTAYPDDVPTYNKQCRAIFNNLKQNQELCNGLLRRTLSAAALATMSTDDMASKELKLETAQMKARADKQSIMVTDDGPRVRRTHKGEEVIEDDNFAVANDNTMSTSRRRSMLDPNADMAARSRENSPGNQVELPDIDSYRSQDDIRGNVVPKKPLPIDTKPGLPTRKPSGQADFDINKVFSNIPSQSPVSAHHARRQSSSTVPPVNGPGVDADIDRMLDDDSPPYSPAEAQEDRDPSIVWRGTVVMDSIAKFPATSKHVAGVDISRTLHWTDVLQKELKVAGRIDREKANEYLCSLRYSPPTDVVVVRVIPSGESAATGFLELYDYFQSKNRYGVLANKGPGNIRDTYLIPVPPTPGNLPDFIVNLEGHDLPEERSEPMILVALVIRNEMPTEPVRGLDGSADIQTPAPVGHPQRQMSVSGTGPAMSPIVNQNQGTFGTPVPQQSNSQQRTQAQRDGEANALKILGTFAEAPTVAFLMPQAFQMREVEWQIIRGILEEDDKARQDLSHLSQVLEIRMSQYSQSQQSN